MTNETLTTTEDTPAAPVAQRATRSPSNQLLKEAQAQGESARLFAVMTAQALFSCAVAPRTVAIMLETDVDDVKGYIIGGMTTLSDDIMHKVLTVLYNVKRAELEGLRGKEQLALLKLVWSLLPTELPAA
jgi:hypothetical protein